MGGMVAVLDDGGRGDRGRRSRTLRCPPHVEGIGSLGGWAPIGVSTIHRSDGCDGVGLDGGVGQRPLNGVRMGGEGEGERGALLRPLATGAVRIFFKPPRGLRGWGAAGRAAWGEGALLGAGGEVPEPSGDAWGEGRTQWELQGTWNR